MRISDWSSDVCSSDLAGGGDGPALKVSETVMRTLRVLATDQRTDNTTDENGKTAVKNFPTVPVAATHRIADEIAVSPNIRALSPPLRPLDCTNTQLEEPLPSGHDPVPDAATNAQPD